MLVHIPEVLTPEQVRHCRDVMERASWVDGRGHGGSSARRRSSAIFNFRRTAPKRANSATWFLRALGRHLAVHVGGTSEDRLSTFVQSLRL